jgi:hypothetical protein
VSCGRARITSRPAAAPTPKVNVRLDCHIGLRSNSLLGHLARASDVSHRSRQVPISRHHRAPSRKHRQPGYGPAVCSMTLPTASRASPSSCRLPGRSRHALGSPAGCPYDRKREVMRSPTAVRSRTAAGRALSTDERTGQTTDRRCRDSNSVDRIPKRDASKAAGPEGRTISVFAGQRPCSGPGRT